MIRFFDKRPTYQKIGSFCTWVTHGTPKLPQSDPSAETIKSEAHLVALFGVLIEAGVPGWWQVPAAVARGSVADNIATFLARKHAAASPDWLEPQPAGD